jgi:hypothetical protein
MMQEWRPRAASESVKLQRPAGAAVCSHSQSGHGRLYFFDEWSMPSGAESKSEEMTAGKGKRRSNDFCSVLLRILSRSGVIGF